MIQKVIALLLVIFILPLVIYICILILVFSGMPIIFKQKRVGKDKKIFTIYKFRTMINDAEERKKKLLYLNQANGPVFKIFNDPRFTTIGKILSKTGMDELPQLFNIIKGEMSFVGPRPLPVDEANKIPKKYQKRFEILPGITSPWVINGSHSMTFDEWMKSDIEYINFHTIFTDVKIIIKTIKIGVFGII